MGLLTNRRPPEIYKKDKKYYCASYYLGERKCEKQCFDCRDFKHTKK